LAGPIGFESVCSLYPNGEDTSALIKRLYEAFNSIAAGPKGALTLIVSSTTTGSKSVACLSRTASTQSGLSAVVTGRGNTAPGSAAQEDDGRQGKENVFGGALSNSPTVELIKLTLVLCVLMNLSSKKFHGKSHFKFFNFEFYYIIFILCLTSFPYSRPFGNQAPITQVLSHDDTHYLVFDQVGEMAASTSYIHVMLPLNITSLLHQAHAINNELNYIKLYKTPNISQVYMTRQYRDIAVSFSERLNRSMSHLQHLDKILPSDTRKPSRYGRDSSEYPSDLFSLPIDSAIDLYDPSRKANSRPKRWAFLAAIPPAVMQAVGVGAAVAGGSMIIPLLSVAITQATKAVLENNKAKKHYGPHLPDSEIVKLELIKVRKFNEHISSTLTYKLKRAYNMLPPQYQEVFNPDHFEILLSGVPQNAPIREQIKHVEKHTGLIQVAITELEGQMKLLENARFSISNPTRLVRQLAQVNQNLHTTTFLAFIRSIQFEDESPDTVTDVLNDENTETFVALTDEVTRHKRFDPMSVASFLGAGAKIIGTFMGLYNAAEIRAISNKVYNLEHTQDLIVQVTNRHQKELDILKQGFSIITATFLSFIEFNPSILYAKLNDRFLEFEDRITKVTNAVQQLQHRRLAVDWLNNEQLTGLHNSVIEYAEDKDYTLLTKQLSDYFQLETSYLRSGTDVIALLHIPCIMAPSMLSIYRYVPFPIPLPQPPAQSVYSIHQALYPTRLSEDEKLPELSSVPTGPSAEALYLVADADLIAIDKDSNFRLLSQSDLAGCIQRNHVYLCEQQHVLRTNLTETCLGSLYHKNPRGVRENCRFDRRPLQERVYQMSSNEYLVYSPISFTTRLSCLNGSSYTADFGQTTRLIVPNGCTIQLKTHTLRVDEKFHLPLSPQISEWKWSPLDLPSDLLDRSVHVDFNLLALQDQLDTLRNDSTLDVELPVMVERHLQRASNFGVIVWSLLSLSLLTPFFLAGWYFYRRHRRQTRHIRYSGHYVTMLNQTPPSVAIEMNSADDSSAPPMYPKI